MRYLIWATDHVAWWNPNREGYTRDVAAAGRYDGEEVADILANDYINEQRVIRDRPDAAAVMAERLKREASLYD